MRTTQPLPGKNTSERSCRGVEGALTGVLEAFQGLSALPSGGLAVARLDRLFLLTETGGQEEVAGLVEEVLRHSLAVAQVAAARDAGEICLAARRLLEDLARLREGVALASLRPGLELPEQGVNSALLRTAISSLSIPRRPLDSLLAVLDSRKAVGERTHDDLQEQVLFRLAVVLGCGVQRTVCSSVQCAVCSVQCAVCTHY